MSLALKNFKQTTKPESQKIFALSVYDSDQALATLKSQKPTLESLVPFEYYNYLPLFSEVKPSQLPLYRLYDYKIPSSDTFLPSSRPLYSLSWHELTALQQSLDEHMCIEFIHPSSSPAEPPIVFGKNPHRSLCPCVDYHGLNAGTIKNQYSLPLIQETPMSLSKTRIFTMLNVQHEYNLIRMGEG